MRKTIFTLGLMLAAALSLTSCSKNEEVNFTPELKPSFELFANLDSRTTNDGIHTNWAAGDEINVFHAVAGTEDYVNDTPYVDGAGTPFVTDGTGNFTGTLAEELTAEAYDWYTFYPYSSYIKTPANTSSGYTPIGCESDEVQTQSGNDNMSHIAGGNYPLYGVAKSVDASDKLQITMKHLTSLLAFDVYDQTGEGFVVNSIAFTAPEDIVGTYYINFASEPVVYTGSGDTYVSSTATLTVKDGEEVTADGAMFYMGIKPFTAKASSTLTVKITTDKGTFEKSITLTKDTTFAAGKFKTITVNVDEIIGNEPSEPTPDGETTATISFASKDNRIVLNTNQQVWVSATDSDVTLTNNKAASTTPVADYADPARFYQGSEIVVSAGAGLISKIVFNCAAAYENSDYPGALKSSITTGSVAVNGNIITVTLDTPVNTYTISSLVAQTRFNSVELTYTPIASDASSIVVIPTILHVTAEDTSASATISAKNITEEIQTNCDATWVKTITISDNNLNIILDKNTSADAREATITLSANGVEATLTITQEGAVTLATITIAEFLNKEVSSTAWYQLTGTISSIANTTYGNFDITDETGTVYVYGLTAKQVSSNDKSFATLGLKEGDVVTLIGTRAEYKGSAQVGGPAYYVSHTTPTTPEPEPEPELPTEGETVTFKFDQKSGSGNSIITRHEGVITCVVAKGTSANAPNEHDNGHLRFMGGNTMTISGATITKVVFEFASGYVKQLSANVGDIQRGETSSTWIGSAQEVVFKNEETAQARILSVKVTYTANPDSVEKTEQNLSFTNISVNVNLDDTYTGQQVNNAKTTVTYSSSNEAVATVDENTGAVTLVGAGNTTIKATAEETEEFYRGEASYTLTVNPASVVEGDVTTITMETFSAISAAMDDVISYACDKGGGTSVPAVNNEEIRLYQNGSGTGGGYITITAKEGYTISSVTIGSSMATKVAHTVGESTTKSATSSLAANGKHTVSDVNGSSISIYCMGTDKNSRLYVNYLSVSYKAAE